jgi:hypothetical protein
MVSNGYDDGIFPVSELPAIWNVTCGLRFISSADLRTQYVEQCEDATVTYMEPNVIYVSAEEFAALQALLDAPERDLPRLRKLMQQTPIWEERE